MFFGNFKFLVNLFAILGVVFLFSKLRYFILFISWSVIAFCLGILFIKFNSNNLSLQLKIDNYFQKFISLRLVQFLLKLFEKFSKN